MTAGRKATRSCFDELCMSGGTHAAQHPPLTLSPSKGERNPVVRQLLAPVA